MRISSRFRPSAACQLQDEYVPSINDPRPLQKREERPGADVFPPLLSLINNARRLRLRRRVGIDQDWLNRGTMVILLVGLLIPTNYHRPPIQPSSGKSDGRPRIVGARSAPFDIANAPKRTLRVAARRQIVFKGGSNASCKADNDRERQTD